MAHKYQDFGTAMLAYRNRPEGEPVPVKTNWSVVPANDNDPEETADFGFERNLLITPSVQEIMRHVRAGDIERNDLGQIVRIGKLRFSDGTQTEKAYTEGPDGKVVQYDRRMPVGAMLGTNEQAKQQTGGKSYTKAQLEQSNLYFANVLRALEPRYVKRGKRRNGPSATAQQNRTELEKAIANTPVMPRVTKLKAGLPCGGERVADSFVGMQKGRNGESGFMMWQDMCSAIIEREVWEEALAELGKEDQRVLDTAMTARSFAEVGMAAGQSRAYADKRSGGKRRLKAANDNLSQALKLAG